MNVALGALFGLAFGSFANAAIDRIPRGVSLNGRSHCDGCGATLSALQLLPVLSYVAQRGQCTDCHARIGLRTPLVEVACAVAFAAAFIALPAAIAIAASAGFVAVMIGAGIGLVKWSSHQ